MTEICTVKVDVYPDDFMPIMKAIKYATTCEDKDSLFNAKELAALEAFLDEFCSIALNGAV